MRSTGSLLEVVAVKGFDRGFARRRGMLAGVATVVAGALGRFTAQPAEAQGAAILMGTTNTATAATTLQTTGTTGGFTLLTLTNTKAFGDALQVQGGPGGALAAAAQAIVATGGDNSQFTSSGPSNGGDAIQATGGSALAGGAGGIGVRGTGGNGTSGAGGAGVQGTGGSPGGIGVRAFGGGTSGSQGAGVSANTNSAASAAVFANNGGSGPGVAAFSLSGIGVRAEVSNTTGVFGVSMATGSSAATPPAGRIGVAGSSDTGTGVRGSTVTDSGVWGTAASGLGVLGQSSSGAGLFGDSTSTGGYGVFGRSTSGAAIFGTTTNGFAGSFDGPVFVQGSFTVSGGPKSAAVPHPDGSLRRMYCQESPEPWFEDFGAARLVNGRAEIALDPDFDALVRGDEYLIFLTAEGDCKGLFVSKKGQHGFTVEEMQGGKSTLSFSYRVVSRRREVVGKRLEKVERRKGGPSFRLPAPVNSEGQTPAPPRR